MMGDWFGFGVAPGPKAPGGEAPTDVGANAATPPTTLMMRRLGSARDLVRYGRKLSRTGFDMGEQFTEKGSTVVAEVRAHHPLHTR
jgi:hypothetical protein